MEVSVKWEKKMSFVAQTESGHAVKMDAPAGDGGGDNSGPRPTEVLLCGVGACSSMDLVEIMKETDQNLTALTVEVRGERPSEYPMYFTDLYLHYSAQGDIDPAIFAKALAESMDLYCAAGLSLRAAKHYTYEINGVQYTPEV